MDSSALRVGMLKCAARQKLVCEFREFGNMAACRDSIRIHRGAFSHDGWRSREKHCRVAGGFGLREFVFRAIECSRKFILHELSHDACHALSRAE